MAQQFEVDDKPEKYGKFFIVGLSGESLDDYDKALLGELRPWSILLLKRNLDHNSPYEVWVEKLGRLLDQVRSYTGREKILVSLDHEGGKVLRTPPPITSFPEPAAYVNWAEEVASAMALELASLGVNLSWAPLADISSNPANPVIGRRAFAANAQTVAQAGVKFCRSLMSHGVLACAKHFPGHGDTSSDSHFELPYLDMDLAQLRKRELLPFKALIDAGVPFVMTAHIMFPRIDPQNPATLSARILGDILRKEMGFEGVIVADDLGMKAVSRQFERPEGIATAFNAGCDMFIVARHPDPVKDDFSLLNAKHISRSLRDGALSEKILEASSKRIDKVFEKLEVRRPIQLDRTVLNAHAVLAETIGLG